MESKSQDRKHDRKGDIYVTRREFIKYSAGTAACLSLGTFSFGCAGSSSSNAQTNEALRFVFMADSRG